MSSTERSNDDTQPEYDRNINRNDDNNINIRLGNPTIRKYFQKEEEKKYEGYVDEKKLNENIRILVLNPHGCNPNNKVKMNQLKEAIEKFQLDIVMLNETNTKWDIVNIGKMERYAKKISRGAQIIVADSKQWNLNNRSYLPGGLLTIIFERCKPYIEKKTIKIGKLGNWSAISLKYKGKHLELINLYRIPASSSYGPYCSATQYAKADRKIKSIATY